MSILKKRRLRLLSLFVFCLALSACGGAESENLSDNAIPEEAEEEPDNLPARTLSGIQRVIIEGFDWGPAVTKTILTLSEPIDPDSVTAGAFSVTERKESFDFAGYAWWLASADMPVTAPPPHIAAESSRTVTDAYPCDASGKPVARASDRIALELAYNPDTGSPCCFDLLTWHNTLCDPYELMISLNDTNAANAPRTETGVTVSGLEINPFIDLSDADMPQTLAADLSGSFSSDDGHTLLYADYHPNEDGRRHPLVIWLHGAGEGGLDPSIALLGNKVTALFGENFQDAMGGAYILVPQAPDFWMVYNANGDWQDNPGVSSVYNITLMQLISEYVEEHPAIDPDRIYIGGCSNGGYMTMDMILTHPDYFAAAFPICEAYPDSGITDIQLDGIQNLPIWFVYAENDETVIPDTHEIPTIQRLRDIGADVHASVYPNVKDTSGFYKGADGGPYEYNGHWSWLYFLNNECQENGVKLWDWLAEQSR